MKYFSRKFQNYQENNCIKTGIFEKKSNVLSIVLSTCVFSDFVFSCYLKKNTLKD